MAGEVTTLTNAEILVLIREIARYGAPLDPAHISKRRFDQARIDAQLLTCPTTSNLCRRFESGWPDLLDLALRDGTSFRTDASRSRVKSTLEGGGTDRLASVSAIALVAKRLGATTLRPDEYEHERQAIIGTGRGKRRAAHERRLPTTGQIQFIAHWDELLAEAGLEMRPPTLERRLAPPLVTLIERFLEAQGYLPGRKDLERYAREQRIAVPRATPDERLAAYDELRSDRTERGLWTPPSALSNGRTRPPWSTTDQASAPPPDAKTPQRRNYWNLDRVKLGLKLAVRSLSADESLNQPTLRRLSKENRAIPGATVVGNIAKEHRTTFRNLRDEAIRAVALEKAAANGELDRTADHDEAAA